MTILVFTIYVVYDFMYNSMKINILMQMNSVIF